MAAQIVLFDKVLKGTFLGMTLCGGGRGWSELNVTMLFFVSRNSLEIMMPPYNITTLVCDLLQTIQLAEIAYLLSLCCVFCPR